MREKWDSLYNQNAGYVTDLITSQVKLLLRSEHIRSNDANSLCDCLNLNVVGVRKAVTKVPIPKEHLRLVPVSPNVQAGPKPSMNALNLGVMAEIKGKKVYVYIASQHKLEKKVDDNEEFFAPFWLVLPTQNSLHANMHLEAVTRKVEGKDWTSGTYLIPTFVNSRALKAGETLYYLHPGGAAHPKYAAVEEMPAKRPRNV